MTKARSPQRGGVYGILFVFCLAAALAGLGFDLGLSARARFWIGDQPGAAFAVGIAATLFAIIAALVGRAVLGRNSGDAGSSDAGPHS